MIELVAKAGPRALTPDLGPEVLREIATSPRLQYYRQVCADLARLRQQATHERRLRIARENERTEHKAVNGLGTLVARIDQEDYFQMRAIYGDDCWEDPEFVEAFLRDNPICRVRVTRGTRGQEYRGAKAAPTL